MEDEPNALGPVGNFFMAALLIFLCGLSFFSTVGRQFQVRQGMSGRLCPRSCIVCLGPRQVHLLVPPGHLRCVQATSRRAHAVAVLLAIATLNQHGGRREWAEINWHIAAPL